MQVLCLARMTMGPNYLNQKGVNTTLTGRTDQQSDSSNWVYHGLRINT